MSYTKNKFSVAREKLSTDYNRLGSIQAVADEYEISKKLVLNHMQMLDIPRSVARNNRRQQIEAGVKEFAKLGFNGCQIARELKTSSTRVYDTAKKFDIEITNNFHKGFSISDSGYKLVRYSEHPQADCKGYVREHRLVMERFIGEFIEEGQCVHHIDGNTLNNSIENLLLMSIGDHVSLHHTGKVGRGVGKKPQKNVKTLKI